MLLLLLLLLFVGVVEQPVDCPCDIASGLAKRLPGLRVCEAHGDQLFDF